jgi:hypothetical protein
VTAPRDIVDLLECVLSIYFSGVRHNLRAAFILCDETVEVTLRAKIKEEIRNPGQLSFYDLLSHTETSMNPRSHFLGKRLFVTHQTRNDMQHNSPAAAVDVQHCADATADAVECIEHCFPGAMNAFPDRLKSLYAW